MNASGGLVVHVVDDDADVRTGFTRLLRSAGLEVCAYPSAERFLDKVDSAAPGCILLDVSMPGISGPDALVQLRDRRDSPFWLPCSCPPWRGPRVKPARLGV